MKPWSLVRRVARHPVGQNAASLLGVQFATFILPLLTLPYLSRVLEEHAFGVVLIAQGLALVLGLLIDFGFEYTGARDVAQSRGDDERIAALAARILGARLLLILVATVAAIGALLVIEALRAEPAIVAFAWLTAVAQGLYPGWFFVGHERLRLISLVQFVARLTGVIGVFVLVAAPGDVWIAVACNALATTAVCLVGTTLMYRRIPFRLPQLRRAPATLRESTAVFAGTGAIAVYSSANVLVLGFFAPSGQVAQFGAAERIVRSLVQLMGPVAMAVFPRMARLQSEGATDRARKLAFIAVGVLATGALTGAAVLALAAGWLVPFVFGADYEEGVGLLRILVLILPLIGVTSVLAGGWMMALRMDGAIVRSALRAGATSLVLSLTLTPIFGPEGLAVSVVAAEIMALASCLWEIRRHGRSAGATTRHRPRSGYHSGRMRRRMMRALLGGVAAIVVVAVLALVLIGGDDGPSGPRTPQLTGSGPLDYDRAVPLKV
ncbi:MAG: oligosaccharide flippase family protein, partial [Solirubrobacteraceae bacterium]